MGQRVRRGIAVVAAALVLAYVGTASLSQAGDFAPWPASLFWLGVISVVCGALLALSCAGTIKSMVIASALAVLIFGGFWGYVTWALLGELRQHISFFDFILSDLVFLYVAQRGSVMFAFSALFGLFGTAAVSIYLSFRPR